MNLNQITLPATNVERSVAFYRTLGFNLIVSALPRYARFECPVGGSTFSLEHVETPPKGATVVVYFECGNLDATYAELQARGITFESPPTDQPWLWREAYLRDPDSNLLCLYYAGDNRRNPPWRLRTEASVVLSNYLERTPRYDLHLRSGTLRGTHAQREVARH